MYGVRRCGYPCAAVLRPSGGASGRLCIVRWRGTFTLRGFEPLLAIVLLIRRALVAGVLQYIIKKVNLLVYSFFFQDLLAVAYAWSVPQRSLHDKDYQPVVVAPLTACPLLVCWVAGWL